MTLKEANVFLTALLDILNNEPNAEFHRQQLQKSSDVFCDHCRQHGYVSEEERDFLIENNHIVHDHIVRPVLPKITLSMMENHTPFEVHKAKEYVLVSRFCPKCSRSEFGDLSKWRD